jgi:hypothetical protein
MKKNSQILNWRGNYAYFMLQTVRALVLVSIMFIVHPEGDFRPIQKNIHTYKMKSVTQKQREVGIITQYEVRNISLTVLLKLS